MAIPAKACKISIDHPMPCPKNNNIQTPTIICFAVQLSKRQLEPKLAEKNAHVGALVRPNIKHPLPGEEIHGSVCNTSCPALFVHLLFKNQRIRTSNRWIQTYCQRFVDKLIHVWVACCGHNSAKHERVQMVAHVESSAFLSKIVTIIHTIV